MGQVVQDVLGIGAVVAAPFTAGTSLAFIPGLLGVAGTVAGQLAGNAQSNALTSNAEGALGAESAAAKQLDQPVPLAPFLQAEKGAIQTENQNAGQGVPNTGAARQAGFGDVLSAALNAVLNQQSSNRAEAGQLLGNAAGGYAGLAKTSATNTAGLGGGLGSAIQQILNPPGKSGTPSTPEPSINFPGGTTPTINPVTDNPGQDIPAPPSTSYTPALAA